MGISQTKTRKEEADAATEVKGGILVAEAAGEGENHMRGHKQ